MTNNKELGKIPPHNSKIEASLLGALLQYNDSFIQIQSLISTDSFYKPSHKLVFESITRLHKKEIIVDVLQVCEDLIKNLKIDEVGGFNFVASLTNTACLMSQIESYAMILKEKELSRKHIQLGSEIVKRAYSEDTDPIDNNSFISDSVYSLSNLITLSREVTNVEILGEVLKQIELAESTKGMTGVDTGLPELNRITGGLQKSDLIIIAGRPAMGKTALALTIAKNAKDRGSKVAFFSLEMAKDQLMKRLLANDASIDANKLKTGQISDLEWNYIHESVGRLENPDLVIIDDIFSLIGIISKSKVLHAKHGLDIIIIDYLQLVANKINGGNREQEISSIARGFKMLAKSLNVPVIALSQLSRSVETRGGDKRPILSDLRESGAIEQDADIVSFCYRASYYGYTEDAEGNSTDGTAEMIIAKNRSGSLANLRLSFEGKYQRFATLEDNYKPIEPNMEF